MNRKFAMNRLGKTIAGGIAASLVTLAVAAPAQAQYSGYDPYYDRNYRRDTTSDIIRGVAVAGAAAAAVGAISNAVRGGIYGGYGYPNSGYGYGYGQYGYGERAAVNACARVAERYGRVNITDIDYRSRSSFRVRGVIDNRGYGGYGYGGGYDDRYDRYGRYDQARSFKCDARYDGRVTDFDIRRIRY